MPSYRGYRFPPEIISHAVWLYHRFSLSVRDVEDLLAERGITVTYETIRQWCLTFGIDYARRLRSRRGRQGDTWHLDELFIRIQGRQQYLWQAVDEDGDEIDILVQPRRNRRAAIRFFRKLLKTQGGPSAIDHRQAAELWCRLPHRDAVGRTSYRSVRQQPRGGLT
jgi:putative transposase